MKDYIIRATAADGYIRAFAARTTNMVNEAQKIHGLYPVASAALGRLMTAASMMGADLKGDNDSLSLIVKGGGPLGSIVVVANPKGRVKGYVANPIVDIPLKHNGKLDVSTAVGNNGTITVIKDFKLSKPYIGQVQLISGEIGEDIAYYYMISEQQPSAVGLGVLVDTNCSILAAGGIILQTMPGASEDMTQAIENKIAGLSSISGKINDGATPEALLDECIGEFGVKINAQIEPYFKCDCNRERLESVLLSLGKDEISDIINTDGKAELQCHYCNKKYVFSMEELKNLLDMLE